jgi:hypothetical protein
MKSARMRIRLIMWGVSSKSLRGGRARRLRIRPANLVAPRRSYRSSAGGDKAVGALSTDPPSPRHGGLAGRNVRQVGLETGEVEAERSGGATVPFLVVELPFLDRALRGLVQEDR